MKDAVQNNSTLIQDLQQKNDQLQYQLKKQAKDLETIKTKNNIVIHGLSSSGQDSITTLEDKSIHFLSTSCSIQVSREQINYSRRLSKFPDSTKCPILVTLSSFKIKASIMNSIHKLRNSGYSITKDYDKDTLQARNQLIPLVKRLRIKNYDVKLKDDIMFIDDKPVSASKAEALLNSSTNPANKRSIDQMKCCEQTEECTSTPINTQVEGSTQRRVKEFLLKSSFFSSTNQPPLKFTPLGILPVSLPQTSLI